MTKVILRPVDPARDFAQIAALFYLEQEGSDSQDQVRRDYESEKDCIFCLSAAQNEAGQLLGFSWGQRSREDAGRASIHVIVKPEHRGLGAGRLLLAELEGKARAAGVRKLRAVIHDNRPDCLSYAYHHGFFEVSHHIGLALDLGHFDAARFAREMQLLEKDGFVFTSMEELGNTREAQQKLYLLNNATAMERLLSENERYWGSFEEFQKDVCQSDWYMPAGYLTAIHSDSGDWAAMSAVTRFPGSDHAYNLHTGVDSRYHGKNLAAALLARAALFARDKLQVKRVVSQENALHLDAISVYRHLGYQVTRGTLTIEKTLEEA